MEKKPKSRYLLYGVLVVLGIFSIMAFISLIRPFPIAGAKATYAKVTLIYLDIIKSKGDHLPLKDQLNYPDPLTKLDAIFEIKKGDKKAETIQLLLDFLKSPKHHPSLKDNAIWALGEMKAKAALPLLNSLKTDRTISQYELKKSILKIKGEYTWRKRISNQFN